MKTTDISRAIVTARGFVGALGWSAVAVLALPALSGAQTARDSALYIQAQQMVANGDAAAGRRLADSVAAAAQPGTPAFAEGLYWKATLATNARDSEHAYRQIIVDYPLSGRVSDALIRIGQLESARGDNAAALQHFQRLVLEHPLSPLRADASYWVAQSYFTANDPAHACAANADALANVSPANVELKNRIDFQQQRCRGVALATNTPAPTPVAVPVDKAPVEKPVKESEKPATRVAQKGTGKVASKVASKATSKESAVKADTQVAVSEHHDTVVSADTPASGESGKPGVVSRAPTSEEVARALESAHAPAISAAAKAQAERARAKAAEATPTSVAKSAATQHAAPPKSGAATYAVQVAAFGTKPPATLLMAKLRGRGYNSYIVGTSAPYRVRIGRYPTYAAAAAELVRLKAKQIHGFVADR